MTPTHLSYSSLTTWDRCPKSYELSRIVKAQSRPAWYFVGGTAVHKALEDHDNGLPIRPWHEYFYPEVSKAMAIDPDHTSWLSGGSPDDPDQGVAWMEIGPECVSNWKLFTATSFDVEEIELDVTSRLPGTALQVKGFIDRLGTHAEHGKMIIDLKSGKNKPKDKGLQIKTYAALYLMQTAEVVSKGAYFMARTGELSKVYEFDVMQEAVDLGKRFRTAALEISKGDYPAVVEYSCRFCDQAPNCFAQSGDTPRTRYYDRSNPRYNGPEEEIPF